MADLVGQDREDLLLTAGKLHQLVHDDDHAAGQGQGVGADPPAKDEAQRQVRVAGCHGGEGLAERALFGRLQLGRLQDGSVQHLQGALAHLVGYCLGQGGRDPPGQERDAPLEAAPHEQEQQNHGGQHRAPALLQAADQVHAQAGTREPLQDVRRLMIQGVAAAAVEEGDGAWRIAQPRGDSGPRELDLEGRVQPLELEDAPGQEVDLHLVAVGGLAVEEGGFKRL